MSERASTFLGLPESDGQRPRVVFLPIPLELTTSYGGGTARGPTALLTATAQIELFDFELGIELDETMGFRTAPAWASSTGPDPEQAYAAIQRYARPFVESRALCVGLGGEHSVTAPLLAELGRVWGPLTVVWIDAHCDLRDEYEGTRYSHACVARRVLEMGHELVFVGARTFDRSEWALCDSSPAIHLVTAGELERDGPAAIDRITAEIQGLGRPVYVSLDVDGLDPSLVPGTGTPEPGGLSYQQAKRLFDAVFASRSVVGLDVVELAPIAGSQVSEMVAARLLVRAVARWLLEGA